MPYQIESDIKLVFRDGQALTQLNGQWIDLLKLDTIGEVKTVLFAIASETLSKSMAEPMPTTSAQPVTEGPDLGGYAEQIRQSFQDQADKAQERLNDLANLHESATKVQDQ